MARISAAMKYVRNFPLIVLRARKPARRALGRARLYTSEPPNSTGSALMRRGGYANREPRHIGNTMSIRRNQMRAFDFSIEFFRQSGRPQFYLRTHRIPAKYAKYHGLRNDSRILAWRWEGPRYTSGADCRAAYSGENPLGKLPDDIAVDFA